ncbi:uncharacterized protein [Spinacia oleracea]|uniref:Uncharacterized protein n=1 Tax=Spinacia oleracea TaxID=3562 RepID=A0ABM3R647_SPIOL|nr:uncharacterized protein LOC130466282 [Spinacia oleracea]
MQISSLHHKLRHNRGNLLMERDILKNFTQLQKARDITQSVYTEELIESKIKYIMPVIDGTRNQRKINRRDKKKDILSLDKRLNFLERKLAKIYPKMEAVLDGSNVLCK